MCSMWYAKRMFKGQKDEIFDEIQDYLSTPEGQQSIRNLGTIFAQGINKGIGLGDTALKGKTFGIDNRIIYELIQRFGPKITDKAISKEGENTPSDSFG